MNKLEALIVNFHNWTAMRAKPVKALIYTCLIVLIGSLIAGTIIAAWYFFVYIIGPLLGAGGLVILFIFSIIYFAIYSEL